MLWNEIIPQDDVIAHSVLQANCEGKPPVTGGLLKTIFVDVNFNKLSNKQLSSPWFWRHMSSPSYTVYPKKYAHGFCFAVLCCGYTLTYLPISIRLTSLALWQSNDCPSASKATLMNMDKYFMWIHYERLHNHNKAKHNKTVCIFLGIYCSCKACSMSVLPLYNHPMKGKHIFSFV